MLLSRTLAQRRIAAGDRPSWLAAWGPVAVDAAVLVAVLLAVFYVLVAPLMARDLSQPVLFALFFVLFFLPVQIVLTLAALWATKSRWSATDGADPQQSSHADHV